MVQRHLFNLYLARTAGMLSGARRVAAVLLVMLLTMTAQTAWAQDLPEPDGDGNVTLVEPTYSVNSNVTISGNITANGQVNLTISSGATLSVGGRIEGDIIIDVQGGSFIGQTCTINVRNSQNATIEAQIITIFDYTTITNSTIVSGVILAYGGTFSGSNVTVNSYLQLLGNVVFDASSPAVSITVNEYDNYGGSLTISNGSLKDGDGNTYTGAIADSSALNEKTLTYYISLDAQGGSGGTELVTPTTGSDMPAITPPTRTGYTFGGYYTETNGGGTQYYNADGTSAHVFDLTGTVTLYAKWEKSFSYIDETGIEKTYAATEIDGSQTNLPGGWYVVNSDVALTRLNFTGDTHLILADGKTLSIDASSDSGENGLFCGLSCKEGEFGNSPTYHNLTIYGQAEGTGKVTSNNGDHGSAWSYDYYAKNITINGGVVEAKGNQHGIISQEKLTINGGQVSTVTDMSGNIVTLGWRNPADYIQANEINHSEGSIQIADDKVFTDGTSLYLDTTPTATLDALQSVTLRPFTCVALTTDGSSNITATFDGSTLNETFSIPCDLAVNDVQFKRTFNEDKKTCICWPFAVSQDKADALGKFYQFTGVTGEGKIEMTQVTTGGLEANKPYIFEPGSDISTAIDFGAQTLKAGGPASVGSGFTFKGIYDRVKWTTDNTDPLYDATYEAELGKAYGFALEDLAGYSVGQFVKLGSGAHSRPFRAYLLYDGAWDGNQPQPSARTRGANSGTSLPDVIGIVWISGNSQTTGIETITTSRETDEWYSLDGRKLSGMPATKGLYIHNGRKEVLK